ncbi:MAG: DUF1772 domain-containing protein [Proteobacteria bacterium]|nr:DUF1772 domain-containing protein [Pseudomonadota bacterium]
MTLFESALVLTTLLRSLVAGFLFAFAVVVMPGIRGLNDREFIRAFQAMDGVIQNNQPIFMLVWVGSFLALIAVTIMGVGQLSGAWRWLLMVAALANVLGVHWPTIATNIPLNKRLHALNVEALDASSLSAARARFEPRWNRWNAVRTLVSAVIAALLMVLLVGR